MIGRFRIHLAPQSGNWEIFRMSTVSYLHTALVVVEGEAVLDALLVARPVVGAEAGDSLG